MTSLTSSYSQLSRKRNLEEAFPCSRPRQRMRLAPSFSSTEQADTSHFPSFSFPPSLDFSSFEPNTLQNEITSLSASESPSIISVLNKICRQQELILQKLEKHEKALENQERVLEEWRREHTFFSSRGCDYLKAGRFEEALKEFNDALSRNPIDSYTLTKRGEVHLKLSKYGLAEQDFAEALKLDPESHTALIKLAEIQVSKEELENALLHLNDLLLLSPNHVEALILRGKVHRIEGAYQKSLDDLEHALEISPNNPAASEERQLALSKHMDTLGFYT